MAKGPPRPTQSKLKRDLALPIDQCSRITAKYLDSDPDWDTLDDDEAWAEKIELNCVLKYRSDFPDAFAQAIDAAEAFFLGPFADWANRVVDFYGIEKFPLDCSAPHPPAQRSVLYKSNVLAPILADTPDVCEAGLRIIFWAAASRDPVRLRREEGHGHQFAEWARNLVICFNRRCVVVLKPLEWVERAVEHLSLKAATNPNEDKHGLKWSRPKAPKYWAKDFGVSVEKMKTMLKTNQVRNQKLSDRSYRICVDDLPKKAN